MSLRIWLPLNGDLENKGLDGNITVTNNNATINNSGKIGKCYYFNGSAQYLQLSETLGDIYCGDFSLAVWLKPEDDTRGIIISEYSSTGSSNVAFELLANRVIRVYWNGAPDINTGVSIEKDKWSHVTITKKDDTIKVYVNGELKATRTQTLSDRSSTSKIRIGDDYRGGTSVSYMGYINDVRIYDHALSIKQIKEISKGLVLHYKLDENINNLTTLDDQIYDSSGYQNNGTIIGNLQTISDSPRYAAAANFNGTSAIKVTNNNWLSQGMEQMTINLWIKPITSSFPKLFSCTESGGWNTQSGSSGYLRFPVHVYTNEAQTSVAYKYDSKQLKISEIPIDKWSMITFIYNKTGTRTYINGQLHHTYSNVSYGIHYNLNARLFLGCEASTANPSSPYYTGYQSDFRIYATALSDDDIKELYQTSALIDRDQNLYVREVIE